jgi:hypothetical protein
MSFFTAANVNPRFNSSVDYVHACANHGVDVIGRARPSRKQKKRLKHSKHVDLLCGATPQPLGSGAWALTFSLPRNMELSPAIATKSTILSLSLFCLVLYSVLPTRSLCSRLLYTGELLTRTINIAHCRSHRNDPSVATAIQHSPGLEITNTLRFTIAGSVTPL